MNADVLAAIKARSDGGGPRLKPAGSIATPGDAGAPKAGAARPAGGAPPNPMMAVLAGLGNARANLKKSGETPTADKSTAVVKGTHASPPTDFASELQAKIAKRQAKLAEAEAKATLPATATATASATGTGTLSVADRVAAENKRSPGLAPVQLGNLTNTMISPSSQAAEKTNEELAKQLSRKRSLRRIAKPMSPSVPNSKKESFRKTSSVHTTESLRKTSSVRMESLQNAPPVPVVTSPSAAVAPAEVVASRGVDASSAVSSRDEAPVYDASGNYKLVTAPEERRRAWRKLSCRVRTPSEYEAFIRGEVS